MIKIVGGKHRSRVIRTPGEETVPTKSRVREAVFSALGERVVGANCLDLFAGSGALGFEALSRGAAHVDFVDLSKDAINVLRENKATLREENASICHEDAFSYVKGIEKPYDIVFFDPPYALKKAYGELPLYLAQNGKVGEEAIFVIESEDPSLFPVLEGYLSKTYNYGRTYVSIFRRTR